MILRKNACRNKVMVLSRMKKKERLEVNIITKIGKSKKLVWIYHEECETFTDFFLKIKNIFNKKYKKIASDYRFFISIDKKYYQIKINARQI